MAESTTTQGAEGTESTEGTTQTPPAEASGRQEAQTFTQAQVNKMLAAERRKASAKYGDYDEYKAKAGKLDEATAEIARLSAEIAHRDLVAKVSRETGVPAELLHGADEEALAASAAAVAAYVESQRPAWPADKGGGATPAPTTKESVLAIEDAAARRAAIAENIGLFTR